MTSGGDWAGATYNGDGCPGDCASKYTCIPYLHVLIVLSQVMCAAILLRSQKRIGILLVSVSTSEHRYLCFLR
jgi:hypothetical protein